MGKKLAKLKEVQGASDHSSVVYQTLAGIRSKNDINKHIDQSVVSVKMEQKLKKLRQLEEQRRGQEMVQYSLDGQFSNPQGHAEKKHMSYIPKKKL